MIDGPFWDLWCWLHFWGNTLIWVNFFLCMIVHTGILKTRGNYLHMVSSPLVELVSYNSSARMYRDFWGRGRWKVRCWSFYRRSPDLCWTVWFLWVWSTWVSLYIPVPTAKGRLGSGHTQEVWHQGPVWESDLWRSICGKMPWSMEESTMKICLVTCLVTLGGSPRVKGDLWLVSRFGFSLDTIYYLTQIYCIAQSLHLFVSHPQSIS